MAPAVTGNSVSIVIVPIIMVAIVIALIRVTIYSGDPCVVQEGVVDDDPGVGRRIEVQAITEIVGEVVPPDDGPQPTITDQPAIGVVLQSAAVNGEGLSVFTVLRHVDAIRVPVEGGVRHCTKNGIYQVQTDIDVG
ncbi:hypothetical protein DSECCO2_409150 [anaerobic digester metagenome]